MKIEILDDFENALALYDAVSDPQAECDAYIFAEVTANTGMPAVAWREYVASAPTLEQKRRTKIDATKQEARTRVGAVVPELADDALLDFMRLIWPHLTNPASDADLNTCKNIAVYARTVIVNLRTADEAAVDAYDPATDPNWPA